MARYKPYDRYKDTGVKWLGKIPEHWEVKKLQYLADCRISNVDKVPAENEQPVRLCNYIDVYNNEFISTTMDLMENTASLLEIDKFGLRNGDVIITKDSEDWQDIAVPALVIKSAPDLVCGYHLAIVRPKQIYLMGPYLFRLFQSESFNKQFQIQARGITRFGLPKRAIVNALIPIAPLYEQQAITTFLDHKTSEIDNLIADKEKLITLLQEYRQAVISEAVTKGLDPNVKMKDSGIEWIGEIPEHWEVKKVKYVASINRKTLSENTPDDFEIDYIDIGAVDSTGTISAISRLDFSLAPSRARRIISPGDAIVSTVRTYLRAIAYFEDAPGNLICSTGFAVLSPYAILPKYLFRLVQSEVYINEIVSRSTGVSYPAINASEIGQLDCILPPRREQQAIVDYLDQKTAEIDSLISGIQDSIEQLKEYRQSLISEAVTGKIDVRGFTAEGGAASGQDAERSN